MKPEELIYAIKEGLNQSRNGFLKSILYGLLLFLVVIVFILFFYNLFPKDNVKEAIAEQSCFPLENLDCHVVVGNNTEDSWNAGYFQVYGYQEANAYFEQIKPMIQQDITEYNDLHKSNFEIKWLECN